MFSSMFSRFRTGVLSVGAFTLGVAFEKHFNVYHADVVEVPNGDILSPFSNQGDVPPLMKSQNETSLIAQHGFPSLDSLRSYPNFVVSYDRRHRLPNWVLERITAAKLSSDQYDRKGIEFFEDKSVHHFFRATNQDYRGSGYDRGHLAAAGNYRASPEDIKQTFVLSNIAPQVGKGFNRDKWNDLEKYCRSKVRHHGDVWICTGPLFLPVRDNTNGKLFIKYEVIGRNHVSVPTHFFKAILYQTRAANGAVQYQLECFMMPNSKIDQERPIEQFRIDPEVVERAAGILLFNSIPRNQLKVIK